MRFQSINGAKALAYTGDICAGAGSFGLEQYESSKIAVAIHSLNANDPRWETRQIGNHTFEFNDRLFLQGWVSLCIVVLRLANLSAGWLGANFIAGHVFRREYYSRSNRKSRSVVRRKYGQSHACD